MIPYKEKERKLRMHSFIQQIYIEFPRYARPCSRSWRHSKIDKVPATWTSFLVEVGEGDNKQANK